MSETTEAQRARVIGWLADGAPEVMDMSVCEQALACVHDAAKLDQCEHELREKECLAKQFRDSLEATQYALAEAGAWRPIETAPNTSKAYLVWCPAFRNIYLVSWVVPLGEDGKKDHYNSFWSHFGGGFRRLNQSPTHWMPLPDPPEET